MFHILKSDGDQRLVFGWASVSVTVDGEQVEDLQGDAVDPEELEKAAAGLRAGGAPGNLPQAERLEQAARKIREKMEDREG